MRTMLVLIFTFYTVIGDGDYKDEDVSLEFKISNSTNKYSFSVSKSGVKNGNKNISINYDFDDVNSKFGNGQLLVGFEMKNKTDRSSLNQITCTFSADSKNSCVILDDCVLICVFQLIIYRKRNPVLSQGVKEKAQILPL